MVLDEKKILEGIRYLTEFFDRCPPGFMKELVERNSAIDICLTGRIVPEPGNRDSINDASAFVQQREGLQIMVLDILQGGMTATVAHEFFHIAENTMWAIAESTNYQMGDTPFDRWNMLNPDGFEYHYIYTDEEGTTLGSEDPHVFTTWAEDRDINEVYFVDGYSTTYPTEDRARIFENLATYNPDWPPEYFDSAPFRLKAAYLCACLRKYYASVAEAENVYWEQALDTGTYTWEYFIENYDLGAWYAAHAWG